MKRPYLIPTFFAGKMKYIYFFICIVFFLTSCERDYTGRLHVTWVFWVILIGIISFFGYIFISAFISGVKEIKKGPPGFKNDNQKKVQMNLSFDCEEDESKYIGHYVSPCRFFIPPHHVA